MKKGKKNAYEIIYLFMSTIIFFCVFVDKNYKATQEVATAQIVQMNEREEQQTSLAKAKIVKPEETKKKTTIKEQNKKQEDKLSILAVGDNLLHTQVIRSGKKSDGTYNFTHLFAGIKDEIKDSDMSIINQETILCDASLGYTGYPRFGSPFEVGEAIHKVGFDVVLTANNHSMDKGIAGIEDTLDFWDNYKDIVLVGINHSKKKRDRVGFFTKNNITVAILNYTYGLNGLKLPKGKEYMISLLDDKEQMKKDIAYAKEHSDFVIVCPHWGTEYVYKPTKQQEDLTQFFLDQEVDLVIGSHPHVLEPVKWVKNKAGTHKMLVYYSLGNFVSNQDAMARMLGGMAKITIKRVDDDVVIDTASIEPLVTHTFYDGGQRFITYTLDDYDQKKAYKHVLNRKAKNTVTKEKLDQLSASILGDWY